MITFKQYLAEEVVASKRKSMMHLQNMKPLEFLDWVQSLHTDFGGVLNDLEVSLKVDGLGARFGKDKDGRFFFEGSRTGPIFEPKAFTTHAKSKGSKQEIVDRAAHYDDMFDLLKGSALVKVLPKDTKVICEIFYNPMATEVGSQLIFVTVKYDKTKLGKTMTVVPISIIHASSGEDHEDAKAILASLYKTSTADVKVVDPGLKAGKIDIRAKTKNVLKFGEAERATIKSLKSADKEAKAALLATIQSAKDELADYLLNHPSVSGKDKLGKDIEGLVFTAGGQPVKVTTQDFKDSKKAERTA
jgi:hypothetical protein